VSHSVIVKPAYVNDNAARDRGVAGASVKNGIVRVLCKIAPVRGLFAVVLLALMAPCKAIPESAMHARELLDRWIAQGDSPGVQYIFASRRAVLFEYNGGSADPARSANVTPRTTFNAYSVTKTFTAAAVLQLAERGKVDLDQPISRYLDRLSGGKSPSVRETLAHIGGYANPNPMAWAHRDDEHARFDSRRFVDEVLDKHGVNTEPGRKYAYSNVGYLVLGELIEKVSGQPYTQYVQQQLIEPLGLAEGETIAFNIARPGEHARGHVRRWSLLNLVLGFFMDRDRFVAARAGPWVQFHDLHVNGAAYGGLIANARAFARYGQALLERDDYISPGNRELLLTPARGPDGAALARSLGWFAGALDGEAYYAHAGGAAGYYCEVRVYPRVGRVSVVMFNRTGIRDERILDHIDRLFLHEQRDVEHRPHR
jgi:D-alanyl-D-alanine carboxypeptidase